MYSTYKEYMCYKDHEELERGDYETKKERGISGAEEKITYYRDGSFTRHCGGPCGDMHYDEFGEEC